MVEGGAGEGPVSRDIVLGRIRAALVSTGSGGAGGAAAPVVPGAPPAPQHPADFVGVFVERAREVGMRVDSVASSVEAAGRVAAFCEERGVRRAAVWTTTEIAPIVDRLAGGGVEIVPPGSSVEQVAGADLGLTGVAWGIAETATLVLPSGPRQPRLTSLLPPVHVAVLAADRILPDLHALFADPGALPSALTLVTGPSRSADIGLTAVLGAHGPMEVYVVLIRRATGVG
jgi:L-lactate dehydrogenase complex protein LldG